ncbi:MAG: hypothetical protein NT120_00480 [Candidatus Aenigmarchaeota archaeon]|nr:hypothetical protein [Candidatus Aenigmarchaeota archaeon]
MKNIVVFFMFTAAAFGQDFKMSQIVVSSGEGALTSGLDVYVEMRDTTFWKFSLQANSERAYFMYGYDTPYFTLYASGGVFRNTPWFGPRIDFRFAFIEMFYWHAWQTGELEYPKWDVRYQASITYASASWRGFKASYLVMDFLGDWIHLPGCEYSTSINERVKFALGMDYHVEKMKPLFRVEIRYKF